MKPATYPEEFAGISGGFRRYDTRKMPGHVADFADLFCPKQCLCCVYVRDVQCRVH